MGTEIGSLKIKTKTKTCTVDEVDKDIRHFGRCVSKASLEAVE